MRELPKIRLWVVYQAVTGTDVGMRFVCTEDEWRVVESRDHGRHRIVKEGIIDENEAEKLARGTSGDPKPRLGAVLPSLES